MTMIFAGGGTGGHLFPGLAVARVLRDRLPDLKIIFVAARRGMEERVLKGEFQFMAVDVVGMVGSGWWKKVTGIYPLIKSVFQSFGLIRRLQPKLVFGLGGYSAGPVGLAAYMTGVPLVLHEQNMIPGMTNRLLARMARKIFVSFEDSAKHLPADKTIVTGNPVRPELMQAVSSNNNGLFTVLILGGSQGSRFINGIMPEAVGLMSDLHDNLFVIHQTGETDYENVVNGYKALAVEAEVLPFIDDMGVAYAKADLIIARAGATTIAEITALQKAAIFIPYPHATHNHQEKNARFLEEKGACKMMLESDLTAEKLADSIREYFEHPEELALMRKRSGECGKMDASHRIADALGEYLQ